jgi:PAS domain S-box-containing protein
VTESKTIKESRIVKESPSPILVYDSNDSLIYVNASFEILTGYQSDEVIGEKLPFPWWPDDIIPEVTSKFRNAVHKGLKNNAMRYITKAGHDFYVDEVMSRINGNGQCISNWIDITKDVINRIKVESMIRQANAQMDNLIVEQRLMNAQITAAM